MSISKAQKPQDVDITIIVVDNDGVNKSSKRVVEQLGECLSPVSVIYESEVKRGIPFARNKVLKICQNENMNHLVFIDDDEFVDASWLVNLWDYYKKCKANVVRGWVKTVYSKDTPSWIVKGNFFQRNNYQTGKEFNWAATNNVIFDFKKIVIEKKIWFDENFGLKGGSDLDFFMRAHSKGILIKWVDNAIVYEELEDKRKSLAFFIKRRFRMLNTKKQAGKSFIQRVLIFFRSILKIILGVVLIPFLIFAGKHKVVRGLQLVVDGVAIGLACLGIFKNWEEYR